MSDPSPSPADRPAAPPRSGEVAPPGSRRLDRSPGERYAHAREPVAAVRAATWTTLAFGFAAAVPAALGWALSAGVLDLQLGLLVVAVLVGWSLGGAVGWGAWHGRPHRATPGLRALAVVLGAAVWLGGEYLAYLWGLALLPASTRPFLDRLATAPFPDSLAQQFLPLGPLELSIIALVAWRSAR